MSAHNPIVTQAGLPGHILPAIVQVLQAHVAVEKIILFGSRAMDKARPGSDIDIAIAGARITHADVLTLLSKLDELDLPWRCDVLHQDCITNPELLAHIERVGVLLWARVAVGNSRM